VPGEEISDERSVPVRNTCVQISRTTGRKTELHFLDIMEAKLRIGRAIFAQARAWGL